MAPADGESSPPPHVAVVAFPFSSHAAVLLSIARALAAAAAPSGATLSFLSTASSLAQLRKASSASAGHGLPGNLRFVEVPDGAPAAEETVPVPRQMQLFMEAAEAGGVKAWLEAARAAAGGARVTCVVGDAFVWPAADAAASAGAPWVPVWTAASCALLAHIRTDALREDVGDQAANRVDGLLISHPGLASYRVRDLPDGVVSGDFNYVINLLVHRMGQCLPRSAAAVALNTFPGLDPPDVTAALAEILPNCVPFGPYHLLLAEDDADTAAPADPHGCLAWLGRQPARGVAYVSFGTVACPRPDELRELAAGLEDSGAPFLWSLREDSWPHLPPGFLDRAAGTGSGLVVPWAPQVAVLRHPSVGAFVTHAGWASVLEGLSSGVPMACRPFFGDQRMNARSVAHVWGFGAAFEGAMTSAGVATAVEELLRGEEGARMRARAKELQALVAEAFGPGGECRKNFDRFVEIVCRA
ncbi:Anthocyanidin 3-O-glucosyltransferase [Zea mays]|uniref:Anthocyanidin 3-O-glucosyltransferase n=3 Tax=Zea mays TaxID=4577 RepID=UFOG1_MAIZE|nr:RecName: Full=Anthocyanidin 3-O-glucosyltransferase; AltName: Full=Bronze-1; AltName: Full=Bz-McC allele; AltName: Full=Flavonol 3-O-glucosyltransferase; AltName: Full=UDP-glucose flavonoid 3-O-glucosyltransferase [Zea mays]AAK73112.1 UDPG-flavonoid 3-O-glucosyl transferase [Zea mays]ABC61953.1 UDPG-flavonoid 3-oxy glucosyl transferase [Zea mays]ABF72119.1 UDP-glucose flavonoid-3-O-glucosyltransferase [Zea mays]PWZ06879.1 Anthocyanidin 3-O-glucosyltransferase [Zea mays]CAA31855.1 UDPglucose|eukprot:NP_001105886.1 anthocyanidin 3-O-glucosyltransferase [Zea mays]